MGTATGIIRALNSGIKHLAIKRFTLRYPEEKLKFVGDGYQFDPSTGVGIAGLKGYEMITYGWGKDMALLLKSYYPSTKNFKSKFNL